MTGFFDARRSPPTVYENVDVAMAREYRNQALAAAAGIDAAVPEVTAARDDALIAIDTAADSVLVAVSAQADRAEAAADEVTAELAAQSVPTYEDGFFLPDPTTIPAVIAGRTVTASVIGVGLVYAVAGAWYRVADNTPYFRPAFPAWVPSYNDTPARLHMDFKRDRYWHAGTLYTSLAAFTAAYPGWAMTSSGTVYAQGADGLYTSVAANTPIQPYVNGVRQGLFTWASRTFRGIAPTDGTNAAWIKTNGTAARNAIGVDGLANSATTFTATAADATILQTSTIASAAFNFAPLVRRVSGTGVVEMTIDGGTTWTAITLTNTFKEFVVSQTVANPQYGFRVRTSSDAIAFDCANIEASAIPSGVKVRSSATQTVVANQQFTHTGTSGSPLIGYDASDSLIVVKAKPKADVGNPQIVVAMNDGTTQNEVSLAVQGGVSGGQEGMARMQGNVANASAISTTLVSLPGVGWKAGVSRKIGMRVSANRHRVICAPMFLSNINFSGANPATSAFRIGSGASNLSAFNGYTETVTMFAAADFGGAISDVMADALSFDDDGRTPIACWGDSLTAGQGVTFPLNGPAWSYPGQIAYLLWMAGKPRRVYNFGISGQTGGEITTRVLADNDHRSSTVIPGIGTNGDPTANVLDYAQQIVDHLTPGNDNFLFVTPLNGVQGVNNIAPNGSNYIRIREVAAGEKAAYPGKVFDQWEYLRGDRSQWTGDNLADWDNGFVPRVYRAATNFPNDLHLNETGYGIVANRIITNLVGRGILEPLS